MCRRSLFSCCSELRSWWLSLFLQQVGSVFAVCS
uniref:Uncharacterized protein n=1 Tax=Brassica campestris TaxID=3711 RepID=A0A3P6AAP5_BRACM|nr:unnamed protein product [Brassica rapa]